MSYVDLELDSGHFRTILTGHNQIVDCAQVSASCTGLQLELLTSHPEALIDPILHYQDLLALAMARQIPIGMAEPFLGNEDLVKLAQDEVLHRDPVDERYALSKMYLVGFALTSRKIPYPSQNFDIIEQKAKYCLSLEKTGPWDYLRSLMMAQRAIELARYQQLVERKRPDINISTGAMHAEVVTALTLPESIRLEMIFGHPEFAHYYTKDQLARILLAEFNEATQAWDQRIIRNFTY
jgi:hypothetical protein